MVLVKSALSVPALVMCGIFVIWAGPVSAQDTFPLQNGFIAQSRDRDVNAPTSESMASGNFNASYVARNLFEPGLEASWTPPVVQGGNGSQGGEQAESASPGGDSSGGDLSSQILDPTKPLYSLGFQYTFGSSLYGTDTTINAFQFQPVIPHKSFGLTQIARATLNYQWRGPGDESLQPAQLFNLFTAPGAGGTFGFGPLFNFAPSTGPNSDTFQMGPAVGWVGQKGKLTYGLFNQNLFSESVGLSQLQPVLGYAFNKNWSASTGNIQLTYDWKSEQWTQLPLGIQINRIVTIRKTPVRFFYNPQYNFRDLPGNTRWQHVFGIALLSQ